MVELLLSDRSRQRFRGWENVPPERRNTSWDFAPGAIGGSGADGLGLVRDLAAAARRFLRPGGSLILQMTGGQWTNFAQKSYDLVYTNDWTGSTGRLHHIAFATDTREATECRPGPHSANTTPGASS